MRNHIRRIDSREVYRGNLVHLREDSVVLPRGTHEYLKFIRPSELARFGREAGLELRDLTGITYNPLTRSFRLSPDTRVNYLAHFSRPVN